MKKFLYSAVSLAVVAIVLLLIIPLSPFLMDVMIILNISLAMIILLISMNIKEALEFSIFPSLLLVNDPVSFGSQCLFHKKHSHQSGTVRTGDSGLW